eukprot:CAMPEP_0197644278 /NCGR_PEP_ID=MMETSP1338-20131121/17308_1 /TAXON_ID=43686 ORGANISM="Pelagodinium beii, Strain RCC1491" /NCGR_SAMPLE_ID=MMETSP1338 /ASSEMBLY_ACC=CAM_ASM_000754 /LENGTH=270 /DNA_ID=CAMNT_0043217649 /DNA_START=21 /DNA_END=833 /DNA_ORIENTATION=-
MVGPPKLRGEKEKAAIPGPGAHDIPSSFGAHPSSKYTTAANFSLYRVKTPRGDAGPVQKKAGPGHYKIEFQATEQRTPVYGFGSESRQLIERPKVKKESPFAQVDQMDSTSFSKSPRYGFGSEERTLRIPGLPKDVTEIEKVGGTLKQRQSKLNGPGEHNPDISASSRVASSPSYSVPGGRGESRADKKLASPGPGAYDTALKMGTQVSSKQRRSCTFGASNRMEVKRDLTPGPGEYDARADYQGQASLGDSGTRWSMYGRQEVDVTLFS